MNKSFYRAALFAALAAGSVSADAWDATAQYSNALGNPNGVWTYGWYDNAFTTFTLMTPLTAPDGSPMWAGNIGGDHTPDMALNLGYFGQYNVPTGWLTIHPGPGGLPCVIRWTAPAGVTCNVRVAGSFLSGDIGFVRVGVRIGNDWAFNHENNGDFDLVAPVVQGTTIEFVAYEGYGYGNTPVSAAVVFPVCPADVGTQGGLPGHDALLDNNDFVVYINFFFASDVRADVGTQGGVPGADNLFDNNDFVVYINQFFAGC